MGVTRDHETRGIERARRRATLPFLTLAIGLCGCADVLGLDAYDTSATGTGGGGTSAGTSTGGTGGTGGAGGSGAASSGGTGGASSGGTGGTGPATECAAGTKEACYEGIPGTDGIGACKAGERVCSADGTWGVCLEQVLPKVESCATTNLDESCDNLAACTGTYRWARLFGGAQHQLTSAVAADGNGNVIVVGSAKGVLDFGGGALPDGGGGNADAFVVELDRDAKHLWSKRWGAGESEEAKGVAVDGAGNVLVVGIAWGPIDFGTGVLQPLGGADIFLAKLAPDGSHLWSKRLGGVGDEWATAVAVDLVGNVIVAGTYAVTVDLGGGAFPDAANDSNVFVAKYSSGGEHVWSRGFAAAGAQVPVAVGADHQGNVVVYGHGMGALDFGGGPLSATDGTDLFAAKLSGADGSHVWSRSYGGLGEQTAAGLAIASDDSVVLTADPVGPIDLGLAGGPLLDGGGHDVCVWKVDKDGTTLWGRRTGDAADQFGRGVAVDAAGNVVLAADFAGSIDFGVSLTAGVSVYDRGIVKLTSDGDHIWSRRFATSAGGNTRVASDPLGNVVFSSALFGGTDIGGGPLSSPSQADGDILVGELTP